MTSSFAGLGNGVWAGEPGPHEELGAYLHGAVRGLGPAGLQEVGGFEVMNCQVPVPVQPWGAGLTLGPDSRGPTVAHITQGLQEAGGAEHRGGFVEEAVPPHPCTVSSLVDEPRRQCGRRSGGAARSWPGAHRAGAGQVGGSRGRAASGDQAGGGRKWKGAEEVGGSGLRALVGGRIVAGWAPSPGLGDQLSGA